MKISSSSRFARTVAVMLLLSSLTSLLAPAAVAMSQDEMASLVHSTGLSSKVKEFFTDVLEDAMIRSAAVAQITLRTSPEKWGKSRGTIGLEAQGLQTKLHLVVPILISSLPLVDSFFAGQIAHSSNLSALGP
ncbi:MAG: hypothetical protein O3B41_04545 [Bacteroidetes bacterium]|nr:hypothetical protein [Bacteroidota bacterium]